MGTSTGGSCGCGDGTGSTISGSGISEGYDAIDDGDKLNRGFLLTFNMVAYVTKAGLGHESEFALLCRSFFRWSILVLRRHAYLHCLHCPFFRWFHGGVGIVVLADSRRQVLPGRPARSLF